MAIIDLQRGLTETGRIRIGAQVPTSGGRKRPTKLETFRMTSSDQRRIEQIAELYGGTPGVWDSPNGKQAEVVTETAELDVVVPPSDLAFSQDYELWSAGGCQRRCDGRVESLSGSSCLCDPDNRECDIHTRLSVLLAKLPGLGVWRLDTQGWYAARELLGAVEVIQLAAGVGRLLPARLRLEQRSVKRGGQTRRFAVPVLDVDIPAAQLLVGNGSAGVPLSIVSAEARPGGLTPVPQLETAERSIAEQSEPPPERPPRRNAAPPIPASGRRRSERSAPPADIDEEPEAAERARSAGGAEPEEEGTSSSGGSSSAEPATEPASANDSAEQPDPDEVAAKVAELVGGEVVPANETPQPVLGPADGEGATAPEQPEATATPPRRRPGCTHPLDKRTESETRTVCGKCGEILEERAAAEEPAARPRAGKKEGDEGYWRARAFAEGAERGIDSDGIRAIASALKRVPADDEAFSMSDLGEETWEGIHKLLTRLPAEFDEDAATKWLWPVAVNRGLESWERIDMVAQRATGTAPSEITPAEWVAFGLRLHAGEYAEEA